MILTGHEIVEQYNDGRLFISDFDPPKRLNPNSYNLRLAPELVTYTDVVLDCKRPPTPAAVKIPSSGLLLEPATLYLARTIERTTTLDFVPMIEGRSSFGRLGLHVHVTAGFGDLGFDGCWTLEMHCLAPLIIYPEMEICQIFYHTVQGKITERYRGKYQCDFSIGTSKLHEEFNNASR